jgi:hypothetical protein
MIAFTRRATRVLNNDQTYRFPRHAECQSPKTNAASLGPIDVGCDVALLRTTPSTTYGWLALGKPAVPEID